MILPDVNLLLPAFRKDTPDHDEYRSWLDDIVNGTTAYGISPQVLASVIRIATNPRIYRIPSPIDKVARFVSALMLSLIVRSSSQARITGTYSSSFAKRPTPPAI